LIKNIIDKHFDILHNSLQPSPNKKIKVQESFLKFDYPLFCIGAV